MLTLHEEIERYLSAVATIREEGSPDFLRYGSAADAEREEARRAAESGLRDRIGAYSAADDFDSWLSRISRKREEG